jgi:hypothetical protein
MKPPFFPGLGEVVGDFLVTIEAIDPLPYVGRSIMVVGLDTIKVGDCRWIS